MYHHAKGGVREIAPRVQQGADVKNQYREVDFLELMVVLPGRMVINQGIMVILYGRLVINQGLVDVLLGKLVIFQGRKVKNQGPFHKFQHLELVFQGREILF
ncbi:MAG: hypothetical protein PHW79_06285 [Candidatus Marinimicrobia bacterium]|nr:hypothetical protein [Candidatus Neomarinimicrobiota bacterium]